MSIKKLPTEAVLRTVDLKATSEELMGYREAREVARIRQELRERLMSERHEGANEVLARLQRLAQNDEGESQELRSEYERWKMRFEILAAAAS